MARHDRRRPVICASGFQATLRHMWWGLLAYRVNTANSTEASLRGIASRCVSWKSSRILPIFLST